MIECNKAFEFDLVIIGGGLVGCSLGLALGNLNLKVAIIDNAKEVESEKLSDDARAIALSLTTQHCLKALEVWPALTAHTFPIETIHVSKKGSFGITRLEAKRFNFPALGAVINAEVLLTTLHARLSKLKNIQVFRPDVAVSLNKTKEQWEIELRSGKKLFTQLLVGADGVNSVVKKYEGIAQEIIDHQQTALVANITVQHDHQSVAYERFTGEGTIALLPFGVNKMKSVWIVPSDESEAKINLSEAEYLQELHTLFGTRLGSFLKRGKLTRYPLKTVSAESIYGDGWVLVGNAANTLHPVAAQGFNLGLRDAAALAECFEKALKGEGLKGDGQQSKKNIGSIERLREYAESRQADHQGVRFWVKQLSAPGMLTSFGLLASEWIPRVQKMIVQQGLGNNHPLPKLCRGLSING